MPGSTYIDGEQVELRTIETDDIEFIRHGFNRPSVRKYYPSLGTFGPANTDTVTEWYESTVVEGDAIVLVIVPKDGSYAQEPVGVMNVNPIAARRGVGNVGAWVLPEAQLQNYAIDAGINFVDYLFNDHGLRRLTAETYETNRPIRRMLERFEFTEEGRRRESVWFDGDWIDTIMYGLLRSEYPGYDAWRSRLNLSD